MNITSTPFMPYAALRSKLQCDPVLRNISLSQEAWEAMEKATQMAAENFQKTDTPSCKVPRPTEVADSRSLVLLRHNGDVLPIVLLTRWKMYRDPNPLESNSRSGLSRLKYGIHPITGERYAILIQRLCKTPLFHSRDSALKAWNGRVERWTTHLQCIRDLKSEYVPEIFGTHHEAYIPNGSNSFEKDPTQDQNITLMTFMPDYPGSDLCKAVPTMPIEGKKRAAMRILQIVKFIRDRHISHLDIKLDNFLFSRRTDPNSLVLSDFEFAQSTGAFVGPMRGTAQYTAPEIMKFDPRSAVSFQTDQADLWSLGAALFSLFTQKNLGTALFSTQFPLLRHNNPILSSASDNDLLRITLQLLPLEKIQEAIDPLLAELKPRIPEEFQSVIGKLLRADPKERELTFPPESNLS